MKKLLAILFLLLFMTSTQPKTPTQAITQAMSDDELINISVYEKDSFVYHFNDDDVLCRRMCPEPF